MTSVANVPVKAIRAPQCPFRVAVKKSSALDTTGFTPMNHKSRSRIAWYLADTYLSLRAGLSSLLGEDEQMIEYRRRILMLRRSTFGPDDDSVADASIALARCLYPGTATDCREADVLLADVQRILTARYNDGYAVGQAAYFRGRVKTRLGEVMLAIHLHELAERIFERRSAVSDARADNLVCLASLYRQINRVDEANARKRLSDEIFALLILIRQPTLPG